MNDQHKLGRINVQRIEADGVGRLKPSLDENWSDLTKLEWWAGVVHADSGADVRVAISKLTLDGAIQHGYYRIHVGRSSIGPCHYTEAQSILTGIGIGYTSAKREGQDQ